MELAHSHLDLGNHNWFFLLDDVSAIAVNILKIFRHNMGRQLVDLQSVKFSKSERLDHLFDTNIAQVFLDFFVHLVNFVMGQLLGILKVFYLLAVFLK